MSREASFTFIPESQLTSTRVGKDHTVSINGKYGYFRLSNDYIRDNNLAGKYIKLYADKQKKAIGWKVMKETSLAALKDYRKITLYEKNIKGTICHSSSIGIGSIIKALGVKDKVYKKLPIHTYKEQGLLTEEYHYVQLT